jgi:hypothetical protein
MATIAGSDRERVPPKARLLLLALLSERPRGGSGPIGSVCGWSVWVGGKGMSLLVFLWD